MISFAIKDDGKGISNKKGLSSSQLFTHLDFKLNDDDRRKKKGQGMGLFVVRNLIKKLGGNFTLHSK
jgi:K+-sensing histidine kinase KdpD